MNDTIEKVTKALDEIGVKYELMEHERVFSMEDIDRLGLSKLCVYGKNLFVRNASGKIHYLIVISEQKHADLKALAHEIGSSRLSFGSDERLMNKLGVTPGAVSLAGVVNNAEHDVIVAVDKDLANCERFGMHPNDNSASLFLSMQDALRLVKRCGNDILFVNV